MTNQEMEGHLADARKALEAAKEPDYAVILAQQNAIAYSLLILAECAYRKELRKP